MASQKKAYELKANVGNAVVSLPDGKQLELSQGDTYETSDNDVQAILDGWDAVKSADRKADK